ncbi:MAG: hypothetical protein ACREJQ_05410, partial [bacterium]
SKVVFAVATRAESDLQRSEPVSLKLHSPVLVEQLLREDLKQGVLWLLFFCGAPIAMLIIAQKVKHPIETEGAVTGTMIVAYWVAHWLFLDTLHRCFWGHSLPHTVQWAMFLLLLIMAVTALRKMRSNPIQTWVYLVSGSLASSYLAGAIWW